MNKFVVYLIYYSSSKLDNWKVKENDIIQFFEAMCHRVLTKIERNTPNCLKSLRFFWRIQVFSYKRRARYHMSLTHRFSKELEGINWKVKTKMAFNPCAPSWRPLNTYESTQMNFTFNSSGKIWNCSLNLPFLHPHATISSSNPNTICN